MAKQKRKFLSGLGDYLVQVSLIILSLLVAVGVDRCRQQDKENERLREYLINMEKELVDEQRSNQLNLTDCEKDIEGLLKALEYLPLDNDSLARIGIWQLSGTLVRGVFRPFEPLTYDRMAEARDLGLLSDMKLRGNLSAYTSFRNKYLSGDLKEYDRISLEAVDRVSQYLDLLCIAFRKSDDPLNCVKDRVMMQERALSDLTKILRVAQLRAFHLQLADRTLTPSLEGVRMALGREPTIPNTDRQ